MFRGPSNRVWRPMAIPVIVHYSRGLDPSVEQHDGEQPPEPGFVWNHDWVVYDVTEHPSATEQEHAARHHIWLNHREDIVEG